VAQNQEKTNDAFSEKWISYSNENISEQKKLFEFQKEWFLNLYGYKDEAELATFLQSCSFILDAGCGLGFKAAWFSELSPDSTVFAIDYSSAIRVAHHRYKDTYPNIIFACGDISKTKLVSQSLDFVVCDQVIMHTEDPKITLKELSRIVSETGTICCYWYKKKALPRELLDDHFRANSENLSNEELWKLSKEVLDLGKMLSEMKIEADFPHVPSLGIHGGKMDLQRFIYWNFIKCFWNESLGYATSLSTNFDWYSPVNAKRFSKEEVEEDLRDAKLKVQFFHQEEACYAGRFVKG
jgi:SAM-dependent methyltransferase